MIQSLEEWKGGLENGQMHALAKSRGDREGDGWTEQVIT